MKKQKESELEFENLIRTHKNTIYTVCYMFSKDRDEVADLFQEIFVFVFAGGRGAVVGLKANRDTRALIEELEAQIKTFTELK